MQLPPSAPGAPDDLDEARFRARMARVSLSGSAPRAKDPARDGEEGKGGGFRLGWFGWLLIDALVVVGTVAVVVVWPPVESCRAREKEVGFYAGDTVQKCIRQGVSERISNADQRIKMLLRGSGR